MQYFAAAAIGLAVGVVEFLLLRAMVKAIAAASSARAFALVPAKLLVLAAGLVAAFFIAPKLLWLTGVCIVLPLMAGAFLVWLGSGRGGGVDSEK